MSKITAKLRDEANIWAPDYGTDFRQKSVKDYIKQNNLTRRAYIKQLRDEINDNKKAIRQIEGKDANREAQARFRAKNKKTTIHRQHLSKYEVHSIRF